MEELIIVIVALVCGLIFLLIARYAYRKENEPMWFWVGKKVDVDKISDIRSYNKANGKMWCAYAIPYIFAGVLGIFMPIIGILLILFQATVSFIVLLLTYQHIVKKYTNK